MQPSTTRVEVGSTANADVPAVTTRGVTTGVAAAVTAPAAPAVNPVAGLIRLGLNPVFAVLNLFTPSAQQPDPPAGAPFVWTIVAAVRREFERFLSNGNISADPVQISQSTSGQVTGSLNVTNPFSDALRYQITTQPAKGTVSVAADGTYTYTPNAATRAVGGTDQFVITVRDTGFHLFGGATVAAPVTVAVTPPLTGVANTHNTGASTIVTSGNGRRAFVLNTDNTISVVDTDTASATYDTVLGTVPVTVTSTNPATGKTATYVPTVTAIAANADGTTLYVSSSASPGQDGGHQLSVFSLTSTTASGAPVLTSALTGVVPLTDSAAGVSVSPDNSRVYILTTDKTTGAGTVAALDPTAISPTGDGSGVVLHTFNVGTGGGALAVDAIGRVFVANAGDDTVSVINNDGRVTSIAVGGEPTAIALGPGPAGGSQTYAYVANTLSNSVSVIDTTVGSPDLNRVVANIVVGGSPDGITVSPDGKHLYVAQSYTNSIAIVDTATDTVTTRLATTPDGAPTGIVLSPDNVHALVTNLYRPTIDVVALTPTLTPAPSAAATTPPLGSTHGFQLLNLSGQPATLIGYLGKGTLEKGGPGVGTVVAPGTYVDFEVVVYAFKNNTVQPQFSLPNQSNNLNTVLTAKFENVNTTRHIASCGANSGDQCKALPGYKVALLDPPGTVVNLDAQNTSQVQQLSQYLNNLCNNKSLATCNFTATNEYAITGNQQPFGRAVANFCDPSKTPCSDVKTTITATKKVTEAIQDSVQVNVSTAEKAIFEKVKLEVQVKFQHTWTQEYDFSQSLEVTVKPLTRVAAEIGPAIFRDYGNFNVQMGNTTFNLNNVYFDEPNPNGQSSYNVYTTPIQPSEAAAGLQ